MSIHNRALFESINRNMKTLAERARRCFLEAEAKDAIYEMCYAQGYEAAIADVKEFLARYDQE